MAEPSEGAAFRAAATKLYAIARIALVVFALSCPVVGWLLGGVWGAVIATVLGWSLSLVAAFGITLFYALSQDGA